MKLATVTKQPIEKFSYTVDYSEALTEGDNVDTAIVVADPVTLTISNVGIYDPRVKFWVAGGINGVAYKVTVTTTTADGRIFQDEIVFKIKEV